MEEALSARIEQLVQEAKTEDQEAVVTELRAHEQGLLGVHEWAEAKGASC